MSWLFILGLKNAALALPLALLALAMSRLLRRPALAHLLWVLVLVKLVTPPLVDIPVGWTVDLSRWVDLSPAAGTAPHAECKSATAMIQGGREPLAADLACEPTTASTTAQGSSSPLANSSPGPGGPPSENMAAEPPIVMPVWLWSLSSTASLGWLLAFVWIGGSAYRLVCFLWHARQFRRFLGQATSEDQRLASRTRQLAYTAGLVRAPQAVVIESVVSPMLWGVGSSARLVFPARLAERLTAAETDALLLHELAHYARGDHWVRLIELAAHVLFWWHPVVWWACREIEIAEEQCCDAWVVEHQRGTRLSYAEALLTTIDFLCERSAALPPTACGLGDVPFLKTRLRQIMRGELAGQVSRTVWVAVLGAGIVLSPLEPAVFATSSRPRLAIAPAKPPAASEQGLAGPVFALPPEQPPETLESAAQPAQASGAQTQQAEVVSAAPPLLWASAKSPGGRYRLDAHTGRRTTLVHLESGWRIDLGTYRTWCAAFAPDGRSFVTGHEDGLLRLWDSETGTVLATFRSSEGAVQSVAFHPLGERVAAGYQSGTAAVWDLSLRAEVARYRGLTSTVSCLRWSQRGDRLAIVQGGWSARDAASLQVWVPEEGVITHEQPLARPCGAVSWLAADQLLVAGWDGTGLIVMLGGEMPDRSVPLDKDQVAAAHWSPDCELVVPWLAEQAATGAVR